MAKDAEDGPDVNGEPEEPDLGAIFGSNRPDPRAVKVFVDRHGERAAFDASMAHHRRAVTAPGFDVQDMLSPRRNVLAFYGVGGVGKTALSRVLERRLRHRPASTPADRPDPDPDPEKVQVLTTRLDVSSEASLDIETMVLLLRIAVAPLKRAMPAFDLALTRYWEANHPNESLPDYLHRHTRFAQIAEAADVPGQIGSALQDLASSVGQSSLLVNAGMQVTGMIVRLLRDTRTRHAALRGCERLRPLLVAPPDLESLSYYPHLLAWDMQQVMASRPHQLIVFVDTYEDVFARGDRRFERPLQRMVWLMPNTLFVITGRNRLDWADADIAGSLDQTGAVAWPGLAGAGGPEPTQHLVGALSEHDSDDFLRQRLQRGTTSVVSDATRAAMTRECAGLPVVLDFAVALAQQIAEAGRVPGADDFAGGFPAIITRFLRDLTADERRILQVLCLFDSFDVSLAERAAASGTELEIVAMLQKSFVETDPAAPFPHSIHRLIRQTVLKAAGYKGTFTAGDWQRHARLAHAALGDRCREARTDGARAVMISCFNQGMRLAHEYGVPLGWCVDAAYWAIEDSLWEQALAPRLDDRVPGAGPTPPATEAEAFARTMTAVVARQSEDRTVTLATLEDLAGGGLLSGDALDIAVYFRAESLRNIGRTTESEAQMRTLIARGSRMGREATKGMLHGLRRAGRFRDEEPELSQLPVEGMWLRLRGDFAWAHGRLLDALDAYRACEAWFDGQRQPGNAAEAAGCVAFMAGMLALPDAALTIDAAHLGLQSSRNTWGRLQVHLGELFLEAGTPAWRESHLTEVVESGAGNGLSSSVAYARFAACIDAALRDGAGRLAARRAELAAALPPGEFRFLVEIVDFWLTEETAPIPTGETEWADEPADVCRRWREFRAARRAGAAAHA